MAGNSRPKLVICRPFYRPFGQPIGQPCGAIVQGIFKNEEIKNKNLRNQIEYYEKRKVRHIAIPLRCTYGHCICFIIIIQYLQKYPFTHILYRIKKRDLKKFFVSSLIAYITCVTHILLLISFSSKILNDLTILHR